MTTTDVIHINCPPKVTPAVVPLITTRVHQIHGSSLGGLEGQIQTDRQTDRDLFDGIPYMLKLIDVFMNLQHPIAISSPAFYNVLCAGCVKTDCVIWTVTFSAFSDFFKTQCGAKE